MPKRITPAELLALQPTDPASWVVEGLLRSRRRRPSLLCGYPEAGKSTLAQQLAIAVANGAPFLGRPTSPGHVVFWKNEESEEDIADDFRRGGMKPETPISILLPRYGDDNFAGLSEELTLHPDTKLVIVETLSDFLNVPDISSNDDTRRGMQKFCDEIMAPHQASAFLILHHFNKSNAEGDLSITKILGGTAIAALSDAKIYLRKFSDEDPRRIIHADPRKGVPIEPTYLNFDFETMTASLGNSVKAEKALVRQSDKAQREMDLELEILKKVSENPGLPKWDIAKLVKGNAQLVGKRIDELVKGKFIAAKQGGEKSNAMLLYANEADIPSAVEASQSAAAA